MKKENPKPIYLKDYKPSPYHIPHVYLTFDLDPANTTVKSKMTIKRVSDNAEPLVLNGEKLKLNYIKIDGKHLGSDKYGVSSKLLTIYEVPQTCTLEIENTINPKENLALEGIYMSDGFFCSQNEPEGFRKITYFLDRPDVMAKYTTKVIGDKRALPQLLSNGNLIEANDLEGGKHYCVWEDPFPKPTYLFALVAGDLGMIQDEFTTKSGKKVDLRIYCDKGTESACQYAMDCLKRSMKWDEDTFGLEYDLDIFMIVAVSSFNFGAMENKGLNIFNSQYVLADPKSATDDNYLGVERVVSHEYFHNWTGDRVTVKNWFQLTLKEGLTVFRDQEFSADMNDRALKRVEDVVDLQTRQFVEDAGPSAHPIQPQSYIQMNNFYTSTVYDKGAEVIRMIHTLIGKKGFRKGIDKYFELYDGMGVTTEEFVHSMEIASGKDLTQFRKWYHQVGTPIVDVDFSYDGKSKKFTIQIKQSCPKSKKLEPLHFPFIVGVLGADGSELVKSQTLEITEKEQEFVFEGIDQIPLASINREFSAPVIVNAPYHLEDYIFLMKHDTDLFNRFFYTQKLASTLLMQSVDQICEEKKVSINHEFIKALGSILLEDGLHGGYIREVLTLPSESNLALEQSIIDFDAIHKARETYLSEIGNVLYEQLSNIYKQLLPLADTYGKRKLVNLCLRYMVQTLKPEAIDLCYEQFVNAKTMTMEFGALRLLANIDSDKSQKALQAFYDKWQDNDLVMMKWFAVQAGSKLPLTLENVKKLMKCSVFNLKVPNLARALIGSFTQNAIHFHAIDGSGYAFIADQILSLDKINPAVAARIASSFNVYHKLDSKRKKLLKIQLKRVLEEEGLSNNVYEVLSKALKG